MPGISEHVLRSLKYRASRFYTQNPIVTGHLVACHRHYTTKNRSTVSVIKTNTAFSEIPLFPVRTVEHFHALQLLSFATEHC